MTNLLATAAWIAALVSLIAVTLAAWEVSAMSSGYRERNTSTLTVDDWRALMDAADLVDLSTNAAVVEELPIEDRPALPAEPPEPPPDEDDEPEPGSQYADHLAYAFVRSQPSGYNFPDRVAWLLAPRGWVHGDCTAWAEHDGTRHPLEAAGYGMRQRPCWLIPWTVSGHGWTYWCERAGDTRAAVVERR